MALERWVVKVLCMAGLFVFMTTFVLLPIKVSKAVARQGDRGLLIISVLSCFGGGVFFGAYLTHLNPEVRVILNDALLVPNDIVYPIPELLAGVGFFIILFMERAIQACRDKRDKEQNVDEDKTIAKQEKKEKVKVEITAIQYINGGLESKDIDDRHDTKRPPSDDNTRASYVNHNGLQPQPGYGDLVIPSSCCSHHTDRHQDTMSVASFKVHSANTGAQTRSIIFMIAMSLDCVFEGLALGLMHQSKDVIDLFVAIVSHEFIMCFCIGLELVKYHKTKAVIIGGIAYACTETFGIAIGTCIVEIGETSTDKITIDIVTGVLQALSAGTFIYCSFLGILRENLDNEKGILKCVMVFLGFSLMAGMAAIPAQPVSGGISGNVTSDLYTLPPQTTA